MTLSSRFTKLVMMFCTRMGSMTAKKPPVEGPVAYERSDSHNHLKKNNKIALVLYPRPGGKCKSDFSFVILLSVLSVAEGQGYQVQGQAYQADTYAYDQHRPGGVQYAGHVPVPGPAAEDPQLLAKSGQGGGKAPQGKEPWPSSPGASHCALSQGPAGRRPAAA